MVQGHHQALPLVGELEDGVHVEVVLGELVVVREGGGAEDGDRLPPPVGEDDVPSEVVPGHQVAQVGDPPDPLRLRVPHADLGVSVHLHWLVGARRHSHASSSNRRTACSGCSSAKHCCPDGHVRGRHWKPRRLTRSL